MSLAKRGVAGAVLVGGSSRRMGVDKATLKIDGRSILQTTCTALFEAEISPVVIVGRDSQTVGEWEDFQVRVLPDDWPGAGPLGGILTALKALDSPGISHVIVMGCDFPDASSTTISCLVDRALTRPGSVIVPMCEGQHQWLHAVWPTESRMVLEEVFHSGERAPRNAVMGLQIVEVADVEPASLKDINDVTDLQRRTKRKTAPF